MTTGSPSLGAGGSNDTGDGAARQRVNSEDNTSSDSCVGSDRREYVARRGRFVERVEVDSRCTSLDEPETLDRRVHDPELVYAFRLIGQAIELRAEASRDRRAAHLGETFDLLDVLDRHDARDDRHGDAGGARAIDEVEVDAVVEEELSDQELRAGIDLLAEVREI